MKIHWSGMLMAAAGIYVALFVICFLALSEPPASGQQGYSGQPQFDSAEGSASARRNYASTKIAGGPAPAIGNTQKYEKIASLAQRSSAYDNDRASIDAAIAKFQGIIQTERGTGLAGQRVVNLGIGVPADGFDDFIKAVRAIGTSASVTTIKTDKTNDYLQLRAKRATLEKARAALEGLQNVGGSIDERINVQNRLTDIEEKIQELGVSLGDFDVQNELCTVRLSLEEVRAPRPVRQIRRIADALQWASLIFAGIAAGFLFFATGGWIAIHFFRALKRALAGMNR